MEITDTNLQQLAGCLHQMLSADQNVRRPAEKFLESIEVQKKYPILLMNLIDKQDIDMTIRVAGAIAFKKYIVRNWAGHEDCSGPDPIDLSDRATIKKLIVTLMLRLPLAPQKQLSVAISIIGKHDFPGKWPFLIDEMVEKFGSGDYNVINGVLETAHSIFKRYRYAVKCQALREEIKHVWDRFGIPLTQFLEITMQFTKTNENNPAALELFYNSLLLVNKVFLSLNSQYLPEFFEDNMGIWMSAFLEQLSTDVPCLQTGDDQEAGILEHLRSQVCEIIFLYACRYGNDFNKYMDTFVKAIWELLVKTSLATKYDALVSNALKFLSVVVACNTFHRISGDLERLCENIIIPNLEFRPSDEELFKDSPEEYIGRDIEGSDINTRRHAACDLVKMLALRYERQMFAIFGKYLEILLAKYKENPATNWRSKDTAIYLVTSFVSRGGTQEHGTIKISKLVPLPNFCRLHIIPELERPNVNELPVLKSAALKYIMVFRNVLGTELLGYMPHLIRHMAAESVVVHSYAACTIENILTMHDLTNAPQVLGPLTYDLMSGLFAILSRPNSTENEYAMKGIMHCIYTQQAATMPLMGVILPRLTEILNMVAKNPSRPNFNHYLFETLSVAIKIVCQAEPSAVCSFEEALFPVFQGILEHEILEFMPYVFQMFSLLLEMREGGGSIPEPYWSLFPGLLSPLLYNQGFDSPVIRLIIAFIKQGSIHIQSMGKLNALLGVFQEMNSSKANDHEGFLLLQNLIMYYPLPELETYMRQIFVSIFQRLSKAKTTKYLRGTIVFFCFYAWKFGASRLMQIIEDIQSGMFRMVLAYVLNTEMINVSEELERKLVIVGVAKILTECQEMLAEPYLQYWTPLLQKIIELFEMKSEKVASKVHFFERDNTGHPAAFSQLSHAQPKQEDYLNQINDVPMYLVGLLTKLAETCPKCSTLIGTISDQHKRILQKYLDKAGVCLF